jgi:hypothetical protein
MKVILNAAVIGMIISLSFLCCTDEENPFEVTVVDPNSAPVAGAWIEGGIDWDWYRVLTDSSGVAIVPGHARGEPATIYAENFFPKFIDILEPDVYEIHPTPQRLRLIGDAEGRAVIFNADTLVTVSYSAEYNVYTYDDQSITQVSSGMLAAGARRLKVRGDTLWFSTFNEGIYAYSVANIFQPQLLIHIDIPGYPGVFAVRDSIIAVGPSYGLGALRIFSYNNNGQVQLLISISEFVVDAMEFIGDYLVVAGAKASLPAVFDLSNPAQPVLVYCHYDNSAYSGFILDSMLIIRPEYWTGTSYPSSYTYKRVDISSPLYPAFEGFFSADAWFYDFTNEEYAVGAYCGDLNTTSVLIGDIVNGFTTVAILPWSAFSCEGVNPPYLLLWDRLWILEPR